ncbi:MAG: MobA/MobL family protein [Pseudomonadota bacterium]
MRGTNLGQWREAWADYSNRFLDEAGSEARIDHRTLEAQGVAREATPQHRYRLLRAPERVSGAYG